MDFFKTFRFDIEYLKFIVFQKIYIFIFDSRILYVENYIRLISSHSMD